MKQMDEIRTEVLADRSQESLTAWQKKYRYMKCFRKPRDKVYRYSFEAWQ